MKVRAKFFLPQLFAIMFSLFCMGFAPLSNAQAQDSPAFSQQELDQMLAPIALYPDALLAQVLMASTYPLEVVEAERWSVANRRLRGNQAVQAVERTDWDPSVKSLVAFPQILRMMSNKLDWTERVGDAFLGQEQQVMETVQGLRYRAYRAGNLRTNELARVESQDGYILIAPSNPQVAYEPYYNPAIVYGTWWWPHAPPVYWAPWPGYRERPGFGSGFAWGVGITLGAEFFFGAFDWHQHHVHVLNVNNYYRPRNPHIAYRASNTWQHDPDHRRGAPYRERSVRAKYDQRNDHPQSRRDFRGHAPMEVEQRVVSAARPDPRMGRDNRPEARANPAPAKSTPTVQAAPGAAATRGNDPRPSASHANVPVVASRPSSPVVVNRPVEVKPTPQAHALENVEHAAETHNANERGRANRQARMPETRPAPAAKVPAPSPAQPASATHADAPTKAPSRDADRSHEGRGKLKDDK
jgi:hypothetical protein